MPLERIRLSSNRHYLETESGKPFFWLGDTAWEIFHRLSLEECETYLETRSRQGFNVIQAVVLAEFDGLRTPNFYGDLPLINEDPLRPNEKYFKYVDKIIRLSAEKGIYVALLPAWGDKVSKIWGTGPEIFNEKNIYKYGEWLGKRYRNDTNIIWCIGGDRPVVKDDKDYHGVWRALAEGIRKGLGKIKPVMTFHPCGGKCSSEWMNDEKWLDIHMMQSGHGSGSDVPVWNWIERDWNLKPVRPTLDGEPNYEDHPIIPWPEWIPEKGYYRDYDVRKQCYRSVFAGGCGVTYGHHSIWQFLSPRFEPRNHPDRDWTDAISRPGASQMIYLKKLMESRPYQTRIPDQKLIVNAPAGKAEHIRATRDSKGSYAMIYFPSYNKVSLKTKSLKGKSLRASWYNPRSGKSAEFAIFRNTGELSVTTPLDGPDWVLILDVI
ncbi:MAG TPA: hypothetical protein DCZ94_00385 [Lentisphaeria bacterium]|nr:MAG: hypothetical protein A2X48_18880 [Lentisphaerae bacterium GWF2_49_21]HBC85388.1 hypothetical protein [Lentisphaeria bacterium]